MKNAFLKNSIILTLILLVFFVPKGNCQKDVIVTDFEIWNNFSVTKILGEKFELNLEEEFRFNENASKLDKLFTELNTEYEIINNLKIGAEFRFYRNTKTKGGYKYQKRLRGMLSYSYKIYRFNLSYRLSFQDKDENIWLNDKPGPESVYNLRNKVSLKYDVPNSKLKSKLSGELFRAYEKDKNPLFNKYRITAGATYPIFKSIKIKLFYRLEKKININPLNISHIIGINLNYRF
ncbi:MAG: DUF2490 domain-containing protein [Chlorobi bacterium]|nr:DUF2490 domain-containing protein [Chlorobiota bacterium]